jgi:hypothetical protein
MASREQLSNFGSYTKEKENAGEIADPEQLKQLQNLKLEFESLTNKIETDLVPATTFLMTIFNLVFHGAKILSTEIVNVIVTSFKVITDIIKGSALTWISIFKEMWKVFTLKETSTTANKNVKKVVAEGKEKVETDIKEGVDTAKAIYTNDAKEQAEEAEKKRKQMEEFARQQAEKSGKIDRDVPPSEKETKFGSNQYLKVGGLLGVDLNTRLSQMTSQVVENTKQIAQNTKVIADKLSKPISITPNGNGMSVPPGT